MRQTMIEALTWALTLDPATLKWPAAVLLALFFGLVLFGLVQYQAFNRRWGIQLVLGLAGGAVVVGLGAAINWLLGVLYGLGYVLTWLVWVLTRRWRWWRRALALGLTAGLSLGPWLWLGATEKAILQQIDKREDAWGMANWLATPSGVIWCWMLFGFLWLLVLVGGWGCWSWPQPASEGGHARPSWRRRWLAAAWAVLGVLGLNWYAGGRVDLRAACENGQRWRLGYVLVSRPGCPRYRGYSGGTLLHEAARAGHAVVARLLLTAGADANARQPGGGTPLHEAAAGGKIEALQVLLAAGADVNAKNDLGETPLHRAVASGAVEALRLLLAAGADVHAKTKDGVTSLHLAAGRGNAEAIRMLLAAGAEVSAKDNNRLTPLHWAAGYGNAEAIRLLLAAGAEVNAKDKDGGTPLHWAGRVYGNAEAIPILLAAGARVNERNVKGETVLDVAWDYECRKLLRQAGGKTGAELDAEKPAAPTP